MTTRWGLAGLIVWLGGTALALPLLFAGVQSRRITLHLADGTSIHGRLYRPRTVAGPSPAVVVLHGIAVAHSSCAPGLAVPLARNGYTVLAIDLRGHGRSGGQLPPSEQGDLAHLLDTSGDHPEVEAALDFLKHQPTVEASQLALVGHSRGGWAAANVACRREDVGSVVAISTAPGVCDPERPHNFLILAGGHDELIPVRQSVAALARATGGTGQEANVLYGQLERGTARELVIAEWVSHLSQLGDPLTTRRTVQWIGYSFGRDPGPVPVGGLVLASYAVLAASVGALIACTCILQGLAVRLLGSSQPGPQPPPGGRLGLLLALLVAAAPVATLLADHLPAGGVLFATGATLLFTIAACLCWGLGRSSAGPANGRRPASVFRGVLLGGLALGLGMTSLGLTWGTTWLDLVPTPRRALLGLVLGLLLLPLCLALASGLPRILGPTTAMRGGALWRGLGWLAIPLAMVAGHFLFVMAGRPLFTVPVCFVALSFLVALPLWVLPDRPGMVVARAVSQAGLTAWLLACHLPFISA
jgi:dienelactone hydrolase